MVSKSVKSSTKMKVQNRKVVIGKTREKKKTNIFTTPNIITSEKHLNLRVEILVPTEKENECLDFGVLHFENINEGDSERIKKSRKRGDSEFTLDDFKGILDECLKPIEKQITNVRNEMKKLRIDIRDDLQSFHVEIVKIIMPAFKRDGRSDESGSSDKYEKSDDQGGSDNFEFDEENKIHLEPVQENEEHDDAGEEQIFESSGKDIVVFTPKKVYVMLPLGDICKIVQCPICLGITRKTKIVKQCVHRFCGECIEKAIQVGKKECPACRTPCPSRRPLKADPNNDALIASIFGDIETYEAEEMTLHEEEMVRAKQIQAETSKRQMNAACQKRSAKAAGPLAKRSRNHPEDGNGGRGSSSTAAWEDNTEATKVSKSVPAVFAASNRLSWGKGGIRSPPRHPGSGFKAKLVVEVELKIVVDTEPKMIILVSLNEQGIPNLKEPYICCRPTLSAEQLCLYVSLKTGICKGEIELSIVTELRSKVDDATSISSQSSDIIKIDASKDNLRVLQAHETIEGLSMYTCYKGNMVIGYQKKSQIS